MFKNASILFLLLLTMLAAHATPGQPVSSDINISNTLNYQGHYYQYLVKPADKGLSLVVRTVVTHGQSDEVESHTVFNSALEVRQQGNQLSEVIIHGARANGMYWMIYPSEVMVTKFNWQTNDIVYSTLGRLMTESKAEVPQADKVEKFNYSTLSASQGVEIAVVHFIKQHSKMFIQPGAPAAATQTLTGSVLHREQTFTYDLVRDAFAAGEDKLEVHYPSQALAYQSLIKVQRDARTVTVSISYARASGFQWSIAPGDLVKITFYLANNTIGYTTEGGAFGAAKTGSITTFKPEELTDEKAIGVAMQYFIPQYEHVFLK